MPQMCNACLSEWEARYPGSVVCDPGPRPATFVALSEGRPYAPLSLWDSGGSPCVEGQSLRVGRRESFDGYCEACDLNLDDTGPQWAVSHNHETAVRELTDVDYCDECEVALPPPAPQCVCGQVTRRIAAPPSPPRAASAPMRDATFHEPSAQTTDEVVAEALAGQRSTATVNLRLNQLSTWGRYITTTTTEAT